MDHKKANSRGQNKFINKNYVQTLLLFYIIAVKIQAFVISVGQVSDPLFDERCRQRSEMMGLKAALKFLLFLKALDSNPVLQLKKKMKITRR
ncbi:hypothetical protein AVEN_255591-1 [Araneus ventricosus]|uniref:Uncharacterized protein n=1 Tax=Araneus ventricosus TaxID=182803 RepID=A0A4Y2L547_ARAVE|nr:hypothetical protein AVEN_255591-1 [Araneus ventricosus]